jgi:CHAD domain-containing protein
VREYPRLIVEFTSAVYALGDTLPLPLRKFAGERLAYHSRRARKLAESHATLSPEDRHRLRIAFKKLRYTTEFFAPLLPEKRLAAYLAVLGRLQDELGLINDHITAQTLIKDVLAKRPPGPIQGWMAGRHALLVDQLPEALAAWLAQRRPTC